MTAAARPASWTEQDLARLRGQRVRGPRVNRSRSVAGGGIAREVYDDGTAEFGGRRRQSPKTDAGRQGRVRLTRSMAAETSLASIAGPAREWQIGLAAGFAGARCLPAQSDGGRHVARLGVHSAISTSSASAPCTESVDEGRSGRTALFVCFDGKGFKRIGHRNEGLRGDGAGRGEGGCIGDGRREAGPARASLHAIIATMAAGRGHAG